MENLLTRLAEIGEKADYLNQKSQALVEENRSASHSNPAPGRQDHTTAQELKDIADQHELVRLARSVEHRDDAATEELKKKINEYIREIDQCLKLIGD